jgi:hypothetical protein
MTPHFRLVLYALAVVVAVFGFCFILSIFF